MTKPFDDIAARLRWHRALEQLDQHQYSARASVTRSSLNNWESGAYRLSLDGALALKRTYGLTLDFLYTGDDDTLLLALRKAWRDRQREPD